MNGLVMIAGALLANTDAFKVEITFRSGAILAINFGIIAGAAPILWGVLQP